MHKDDSVKLVLEFDGDACQGGEMLPLLEDKER
jgi:hypothetical protein